MEWELLVRPIFRWLHIIAGITWIGLLYFFNFINGHVAATMDGDSKKKVVPELMPRALYWFRWGAAWTWFTGVALLILVFYLSGTVSDNGFMPNDFLSSEDEVTGDKTPANMWVHISLLIPFVAVFLYDFLYKKVKFGITCPIAKNTRLVTIVSFCLIGGIICLMSCYAGFEYRLYTISIGAMFGTMMAFNVWFRIWPAQQKIIKAIKNGDAPDGDLVALAGLRSKHNTYMSVPLIWTMINAHTAGAGYSMINLFGLKISGEVILLLIIALGWHIVFQLYKKSGKVKGF